MNRKLLMTVSHSVLAHMYQDILVDAGIEIYISEKNGPHIMEIYLGQPQKGVELYVDPEHYEEAKKILDEAEIVDV